MMQSKFGVEVEKGEEGRGGEGLVYGVVSDIYLQFCSCIIFLLLSPCNVM